MSNKLARSGGVFDIPAKAERAAELEAETGTADFWNDQQLAQRKMQELSTLRGQVEQWETLYRRANDARDLLQLAEDDPGMLTELEHESAALEAEYQRGEFALALSGTHDADPAIISIHAGAGGTEAHDWAQMLLRM